MQVINIAFRLFVLLLLILAPASARAQDDEAFAMSAESLEEGEAVELDKLAWRYHAGDDAAWAAKDYNDGDWARVKSNWEGEEDYRSIAWEGRAWFRLRVRVDEGLVDRPLALRVRQWGASEIYLDGELIQRFGKIDAHADEEFNPRGLFVPVVFTEGGEHTIAVRYSYLAARDLTRGRGRWLARGGYEPGFSLSFTSAQDAALRVRTRARTDRLEYVFIGLLAALALVHFLLFAFYRRERGNLFYSFFAAALATVIWLSRVTNTGDFSAATVAFLDIVRNDLQGAAVMALLAFLYVEFTGRVSRFFWILVALWLIVFVLHLALIVPLGSLYSTPMLLLLTLGDGVRIMARSLAGRRAGTWIIAAGIAVFVVCVAINIAFGHKLLLIPTWLHEINLTVTILSIPLAVSIYLARNFAHTNKDLEAQLVNVKELSARQLEHERTEAELRLRHEKERAENERRAQELEEARQLQLSMLPRTVPQLPNLEIAAYMKPATEVGGDYYDFHLGEDGTLTVAVGDATGHGLKANSVVTATKSLFNAFAGEENIPQIFNQTSRALKKMNLRGLYMAMSVAKIKDGRMTISAAGMPPALIYREATGRVEEIAIRAMPLGSVSNFAYRQQELTLSKGDTVLMMTDGFPEMFNEAGEMLDYAKAKTVLEEAAQGSPQEIINRFARAGDEWAGGRPQDDDVTFVVLKVRGAA